jgi:TonB-dependent receptor
MYKTLITLTFCVIIINGYGQKGSIKGTITDSRNGEFLTGANVLIQGSVTGASSDFDGNFIIRDVAPGNYNLVVSFISYKQKIITGVKVVPGESVTVNIKLDEAVTELSGVTVAAQRRTDTEISMISSIKANNLTVNGISAQQISKSQDKDASEVMKRVPGITINDGRFVIVRGLSERYNTVWLNAASTPSFEADKRAFSFDVIPSGMIDNILIYKTPAPELPGDFAGASVNIFTKNIPDEKSIFFSYSPGYRQYATFATHSAYTGSSLDWLGFDKGTRSLPESFPSTKNFQNLLSSTSQTDRIQALEFNKMLNNDWTAYPRKALPDQSFSIGTGRRFTLGKFSVGNITSANYGYSTEFREAFRANYQSYDEMKDEPVFYFYNNDKQYSEKVKLGLLHNWSFVYGNNQKLEFRNLFNRNAVSRTTVRDGYENYGGNTIRSYEYYYLNRTTYSGQLGGENTFRNELSKINYTTGYSFANRNEPDIRRISTKLADEDPENPNFGKYYTTFGFAANPGLSGRTFIHLNEHIFIAGLNYDHKFKQDLRSPSLKAGFFSEYKTRDFSARKLGYVINPFMYNDSLSYLSFDQIFADENINYTTGIRLDETTNKSDQYLSANMLHAGYAAIKFPLSAVLQIYTGVRAEYNSMTLDGYDSKNAKRKVKVDNTELKIFPSLNMIWNISEKNLLRVAYGSTVNRPEFREIAPFSYYDFEMKAVITGNPELINATIQNIDLRYEMYPTDGENITLAAFYKNFKNPIESVLIPTGSGLEYSFNNAPSAYSTGLELDIRKRLFSFSGGRKFFRNEGNLSLILNTAVIKSEVDLGENAYVYNKNRPMQGQSPYIFNTGLYYQNDSAGFGISVLYNIIGKRIVFVGDPENPDVYEMPRGQLDLTIDKSFGKNWTIKAGLRDILNQNVIYKQNFDAYIDSNGDGIRDQTVTRDQVTYRYKPGISFGLTITCKF